MQQYLEHSHTLHSLGRCQLFLGRFVLGKSCTRQPITKTKTTVVIVNHNSSDSHNILQAAEAAAKDVGKS